MEMDKRDFIGLVTIMFLFSLMQICGTGVILEMYDKIDIKEPIQLRSEEELPKNITGIDIPGVGFFVFTKGRDFANINDTLYHEACHEYVDRDYYHFCEEYYPEKSQ